MTRGFRACLHQHSPLDHGSRSAASGLSEVNHLTDSHDSLLSICTPDAILTPPSPANSPTSSPSHLQHQFSPIDCQPIGYQTLDPRFFLYDSPECDLSDLFAAAQQFPCDFFDPDIGRQLGVMSGSHRDHTSLPPRNTSLPAEGHDEPSWNIEDQPHHIDVPDNQYIFGLAQSNPTWPSRHAQIAAYAGYAQPYSATRNDSLLGPSTSQAIPDMAPVAVSQPYQWTMTSGYNEGYYSGSTQQFQAASQLQPFRASPMVSRSPSMPNMAQPYPASSLPSMPPHRALRDHLVPTNEPWNDYNLVDRTSQVFPLQSNYLPYSATTAITTEPQQSLLEPLPAVTRSTVSQRPTPKSSSVSETAELSPTSSSSQRSQSPHRKAGTGGRRKGEKLTDTRREATSRMRKLGACWRCALQRDPCDVGPECKRCAQGLQQGTYARLLGCDRRHLRELTVNFLPESMTTMNRRKEVQDFVTQYVAGWYQTQNKGIKVPLTCGCGLLIDWVTMNEFRPANSSITMQMQYIEDHEGKLTCISKKSPPLALTMLEEEGLHRCDEYLDRMISESLDEFVSECYSKTETFQHGLLQLFVDLYQSSESGEETLRTDIHSILRMIVCTYIMGTTLAIPEEYRDAVTSSLSSGQPSDYGTWTSPRVASLQLKYYFSSLRTATYEKMLKRLHSILRTGGDKNKTWVSAFCIIIGLAMALEECQILIQIQCEARIQRSQINTAGAERWASAECRGIDEGFEFLISLFHCKYRRKNRASAKLHEFVDLKGPESPEGRFVQGLTNLRAQHYEYLQERSDMKIPLDSETCYTCRLVGRLMSDFMNAT